MVYELLDGCLVLLLCVICDGVYGIEINICFNYGVIIILCYLCDMFIIEYGVVDLCGKIDEECVEVMLLICDVCFVDVLVVEVKLYGKLCVDFVVFEVWC